MGRKPKWCGAVPSMSNNECNNREKERKKSKNIFSFQAAISPSTLPLDLRFPLRFLSLLLFLSLPFFINHHFV
ncbi:hypothetical protein RJT34_10886 [Clitoria ternatea]|uniref:Uncharacterized protein n=1 Tax=Clitoria ternatea TaxID=43366 RepID=A0AAN9JMH2_CLITE